MKTVNLHIFVRVIPVVMLAAMLISHNSGEAFGQINEKSAQISISNAETKVTSADTTDADIQSLGAVAKSLEQSVKNLDKRNDWLDPKVLAGLIVGLIAAISGWLVAWHAAKVNARTSAELARQKEELGKETLRESRLEQHVFDSLNLFVGHTRDRGLGIAIVEANWTRFSQLHATWTSVLLWQAVYLLGEAKRKREAHEVTNIKSMWRILKNVELSKEQRKDLQRALDARRKGKGHDLTDEEIKPWKELADPSTIKQTP